MYRFLLVFHMVMLLVPVRWGWARTFYVSTSGNDSHPGTAEAPFATPYRALKAIRSITQDGLHEDVNVVFLPGCYFLNRPLRLRATDGGNREHRVVFRGDKSGKVVLSGGRPITGFREQEDGTWVAELPDDWPEDARFRYLTVNGRRGTRARSDWLVIAEADLSDDRSTYRLHFPPGILGKWHRPKDIELCAMGEWAVVRKRVESIDPAASTVTLAPPHVENHPANLPGKNMGCYFEHARELVDEPGEWYLDRAARRVHYGPRPGEKPATAEVIASNLKHLLLLDGTAARPVENVHFENLCFAHTDWPLPPMGYAGGQACVYNVRDWNKMVRDWRPGSQALMEAAIEGRFVRRCRFTGCSMAYLGGGGLKLGDGCDGNRIEGCHFHDIAGNGISLGNIQWRFHYYRDETFQAPEPLIPSENAIVNNLIERCGDHFHGGVGIMQAFVEGTSIAHNEVRHLPYSGISSGWFWRSEPVVACRNNRIEHNHVHDCARILTDGGGIYTVGVQVGSHVVGNHIHDIHYSDIALQTPRNAVGLYFDGGSRGIHVARNVVYDTIGLSLHGARDLPLSKWLTWGENDFGRPAARRGPGLRGQASWAGPETIPHDPSMEPRHLTLEAWVYKPRLPGHRTPKGFRAARQWIVNKNRNEHAEGYYGLMLRYDRYSAWLNIGGGQQGAYEVKSPPASAATGRWQQIVQTYDGKDLCLYLDGKLAGSLPVGKPRKSGNGAFALRKRPDGWGWHQGGLDEVRLFRRVLSAGEIARRYREMTEGDPSASPADEDGLVREWRFEDPASKPNPRLEWVEKAGLQQPWRDRLLGRAGK